MQKSVHLFGPAELFSKLKLQGVEYGEGMVKAAHSLNKQHFEPKTSFDVAAMLDLGASVLDNSCYDFVKTDRILINVILWICKKNLKTEMITNLSFGRTSCE